MERANSDVCVLTDLGFTFTQARVFLIIAKNERIDIKKIAKLAKIDRSNVYKTILGLIDQGLIMKRIGTPNTYEAMPIQQTFSTLLKHKTLEFQKTQTHIEELLRKLSQKTSKRSASTPEEEEYFLVVPGKEPFYKKWEKTVKDTKKSMDVIAMETREPQDSPVLDSYKPLFKRGVKARFLIDRSTHNNEEFKLRMQQMEDLLKFPNLQVKYSFTSQKPYVAIRDNEIGLITLDPTRFFKHSRTLWTNNPSLISAFQQHFETMWSKAQTFSLNQLEISLEHDSQDFPDLNV